MKILIILLLATSCVSAVYPTDYKKAAKVCEKNEGLLNFTVYAKYSVVYCNNKARFKQKRP